MGEARFFLAGLAGEFRNQGPAGPIGELVEDCLCLRQISKSKHAFAAIFDFA